MVKSEESFLATTRIMGVCTRSLQPTHGVLEQNQCQETGDKGERNCPCCNQKGMIRTKYLSLILLAAALYRSCYVFLTAPNINGSLVLQREAMLPSSIAPSAVSDNSRDNEPSSRFAYAYVVGGCDPEHQPTYRFFLYNILVSVKLLRESGSKADVVLFVQLAWRSNALQLPVNETALLQRSRIRVQYIAKSPYESFYRTNLDKFRILGLTLYDRVLFMDADVMPTANLDYLFDLSMNGTLQENVVIQGVLEPANGGFFMLKPGQLDALQEIVTKRETQAQTLPPPHFDTVQGWGQVVPLSDKWVSKRKRGILWDFHGADGDQGLLYHWTKYNRSNVSIFMRHGTVKHWNVALDGSKRSFSSQNPVRERCNYPFSPATALQKNQWAPFGHFVHFTGNSKPWFQVSPADLSESTSTLSPTHYWFWQLHVVSIELGFHFDSSSWSQEQNRPLLGLYPKAWMPLNASTNLLEHHKDITR